MGVVGTLAAAPVGSGAANPTGDVVEVTLAPPAGMVVVVPVAGMAPAEMAAAPVLAAAMGGASTGDVVVGTEVGAFVTGAFVTGAFVTGAVVTGAAVAARAGCRPGLDHTERVVASPGLANSASRTVKTDPPAAAADSTHTIAAGTVNRLRCLR